MSISLMTEVWRLDMSPTDKMVLLALADAANDDGITWMPLESTEGLKLDLLKKTSLSRRAIQGALKRLCEAGYLSRVDRPGKGVIWTVKGCISCAPQQMRPAADAPGGAADAPKPLIKHTSEDKSSSVTSPSPKDRTYPEAFEIAWKAYPHHKGRSSKPNALREWRKLPVAEREGLAEAIAAFRPQVETVCGGKGAPCMARWIKDGKHLNWIAQPAGEPEAGTAWDGPAQLRAAVVAEAGEGVAASYIDPAGWDGRTIIARTEFGARKLRSLHCLRNVEISISQGRAA